MELLRDRSHVRDYTIGEWERMLAEAGFVPELLGTWRIRQAFDPWIRRIGAEPYEAEQILRLMRRASDDVRSDLELSPGGDFTLRFALMRGRR